MPTINVNGAGGGKGGKGGGPNKQSAVARAWQNLIDNPSVSSASAFRIAWQNSPVADQIFHMGKASSSPGSKDKFAAAIKALRSQPGPQAIPRLTYQPMTPRLNAQHKVYAGQVGTFGRGIITVDQHGVAYPHKGGLPARIPGTGFTMVGGGGRGGGANFYSGAGGTYPERGGVPALYNQSRALVPTKRMETALVKIERATESSARTDKVIAGKLAGGGGYSANYDRPDYSASYDIPGTMAGQRAAARRAGVRHKYQAPRSKYGRIIGGLAGGAIGQALSRASSGSGWFGSLGAGVGGFLGAGAGPAGVLEGAAAGEFVGHAIGKVTRTAVYAPMKYGAMLNTDQSAAALKSQQKILAARLARAGHFNRHALETAIAKRGNIPHKWQSILGETPASTMATMAQMGVVPGSPYAASRMVMGSRIGSQLPAMGALPSGVWQSGVASGIVNGYVKPGMRGELGFAEVLAPALGNANRLGASSLQILSSMNRSLARLAGSGGTVNARGISALYGQALSSGLPGGRSGDLAAAGIQSSTAMMAGTGSNPVTTMIAARWTQRHGGSLKSLQSALHKVSPGVFSGAMKTKAGRSWLQDIVTETKAGNLAFATGLTSQFLQSHPRAATAILGQGAVMMSGFGNEPGALGRANRLVAKTYAHGGLFHPGSVGQTIGSSGSSPVAGVYSGKVAQELYNKTLLAHPNWHDKNKKMYESTLKSMGYSPGDINRLMLAGKVTGRSPLELAVLNKTEGGLYSLSRTAGPGNGGGPFQMIPTTKAAMGGAGGLHGRLGNAVEAGNYLNHIKRLHPNATTAELFGYYQHGPAGNFRDRDWQMAGGALGRILPTQTYRNTSATGQASMAGASDAFAIWTDKIVASAGAMDGLDKSVNAVTAAFTKLNRTAAPMHTQPAHRGP